MANYFVGVRYIIKAHYPKSEDYKEETFDSITEALDAVKKHNEAGANVQKTHWFWAERKEDNGWYPVRR